MGWLNLRCCPFRAKFGDGFDGEGKDVLGSYLAQKVRLDEGNENVSTGESSVTVDSR